MRPRFAVAQTAEGVAIVDRATGMVVAYAAEGRVFALVRFLNLLGPSDEQLDVLLGKRRGAPLLRTITLRHSTVCHRCGARMRAGSQARWHTETKLVRHLRRCPTRAAGSRPRRVA
jgi:hypothetical protein